MSSADATAGASNETVPGPPEPDAQTVQTEYERAWEAFEAADALDAEAQSVRCMPAPKTVAERQKRKRLIADLEAQASAVRPPPANTGEPIPEPPSKASSASLAARHRQLGGVYRAETPPERRQRRHERFEELGGNLRRAGTAWQCRGRGALAALVREEVQNGRPSSDKRYVKQDLIAFEEAEGDASAAELEK